jgi:FkbM family methyltransferase
MKTYFSQFNLRYALQFLLFKLSQKILNPYIISSYSQTGEDRIIHNLLGNKFEGFYIDVGCNHPQAYSNTFGLYTRGWKGVNIDANRQLIDKYHELRPRDINLCAVVSNEEKELTFTEFNDSAVSSVSSTHVNEWQKYRKIINQTKVKAVPLSKILSEHQVPDKFDLLSIDVEGHDFEVLSSLDFSIHRPKLFVIEMHGLDMLNICNNRIFKYLKERDYDIVAYAIMNGYFLDNRKY